MLGLTLIAVFICMQCYYVKFFAVIFMWGSFASANWQLTSKMDFNWSVYVCLCMWSSVRVVVAGRSFPTKFEGLNLKRAVRARL